MLNPDLAKSGLGTYGQVRVKHLCYEQVRVKHPTRVSVGVWGGNAKSPMWIAELCLSVGEPGTLKNGHAHVLSLYSQPPAGPI